MGLVEAAPDGPCAAPGGVDGRSRRRPALLVGCVVALCACCLSVGAAGAGAAWTIQPVPAPQAPDPGLGSVSCSSATDCMAVGGTTVPDGTAIAIAERWSGGGWTTEHPATPAAAINSSLEAVSCAGPTACTAVGWYSDAARDHWTLAERWNGATWTILGTPNPLGATQSRLHAVSCTSSTACTAVGDYLDTAGYRVTLTERWSGSSWVIEPSPDPTGAGRSKYLLDVSCPSAADCIAVGAYNNGTTFIGLAERWDGIAWTILSAPAHYLNTVSCTAANACTAIGGASVERWNGSTWTAQTAVSPAGSSAVGLSDVSCTSATACTAVGGYTGGAGAELTLAESWNGTSWSLQATPNRPGSMSAAFGAVSCWSAAACTAVGSDSDTANVRRTLAERWGGAGWALQAASTPTGAQDSTLAGVSCPAANACTAVGRSRGSSLAERWDGTGWTIQPTPSSAQPYDELLGVSCPSVSACVAVGTTSAGVWPDTFAESWDGTSWAIVTTPAIPNVFSATLSGVSCTSAAACTAVGGYRDTFGADHLLAERWNGTSWTIQSTPAPPLSSNSGLTGVSCSAPNACMAVGHHDLQTSADEAFADEWNGSTWTVEPASQPAGTFTSDFLGVSCTAPTACAAVGDYFVGSIDYPLAERWDGSTWTTEQIEDPAGGSDYRLLLGVSCASAADCTAVGRHVPASQDSDLTLLEHWDGNSWTIQPTPNPAGAGLSFLNGASCASITACTAVGYSVGQAYPVGQPQPPSEGAAMPLAEQAFGTPTPPPVNVAPPTISGPTVEGQTLTATSGSWTNSPTGYASQWEDCDAAGNNCGPIAGATGPTYALAASDVGSTIRVAETTSNLGGTAGPATSAATAVVGPSPPVATSPPALAGNLTEGQTLTETHASWTNGPTGFAYSWERCDSSGNRCATIHGATGRQLTLATADVGSTIRVAEAASNAGGTGSPATSAPSAAVRGLSQTPASPRSASRPRIHGTPVVGRTLSSSTGAWIGTPPLTYRYRWQRCGKSCADIAGATSRSYRILARDRSRRLRAVVTATNSAGTGFATSSRTPAVAAAARPSRGRLRTLIRTQIAPPASTTIALLLQHGGSVLRFRAPAAGRVVIAWYLLGSHARPVRVRVAEGRLAFSHATRARVEIKLTTSGARLLRRVTALTLTAKGTFVPRHSRGVTATRRFDLRP